MNSEKVSAYIGFSVKKGSTVFGLDSLTTCRKRIHLVLFSGDISENSLKKLQETATLMKFDCQKFDNLSEVLKRNCKVLGILDKQLATAILQNLG